MTTRFPEAFRDNRYLANVPRLNNQHISFKKMDTGPLVVPAPRDEKLPFGDIDAPVLYIERLNVRHTALHKYVTRGSNITVCELIQD